MIVEHLPRTRIDGAALWLDKHSPVVALSIRLDRIDCFWFTLLHELGHIFHRHSQGIDNGIVGDDPLPAGETPECEQVANDFARDNLVPKKEIDSFIARVRPLYSRVRINQFANRIKDPSRDHRRPTPTPGRDQVLPGAETCWSRSAIW